jgi:hypothetical protein
MKKILPLLISALVLSSCASNTKLMQRGNYDKVIQKTTKKLMKKPDAKYAAEMDRAYRLANERDMERITYLQREDNPDFYTEVMSRYSTLKMRQSQVRTVTPLNVDGRTYEYEYIDYDAKIIEFKNKAADEHFRLGKMLLEEPKSKMDFREAHYNLLRARELGGNKFPDIDRMIHDARMMGISRVLVVPVADENAPVTRLALESLITFDPTGLKGSEWIEYHFIHMASGVTYDYDVVVNIHAIETSPDNETETQKEFKKKSTKEFDYALDAAGNVMRDTSGNDIKIYKDIQATMITTHKEKTASIRGEVVVIDRTGQNEITSMPVPFASSHKFENDSHEIIGKWEAVPAEGQAQSRIKEEPFPSEADLIEVCLKKAQPVVRDAIYKSSQQYIR